MIKGVIFDCFGVIITDALQALSDRYVAGDPAKSARMSDIITAMNRGFLERGDMYRQVAELFGVPVSELTSQTESGEIKSQPVMDFILRCRQTGYKTALLSNIGQGTLQRYFESVELAEHFDTVVASGDIGFAKPEPEAYEITADRLGLRLQDCLMVDDRAVCVDGARATGMHAILYREFARFQNEFTAITKE